VTIAGRHIPIAWLQWTGILAAPAGWILTFMVGLWFTFAQCNPATAGHLPVDAWTIAATVVGATLALLGLLAAIATLRAVSGDEDDAAAAPPPRSRVHFMAIVGITISPLLLAIILMSGIGATFLTCHQS
jgi:hypothetical protein